jgi:hypothetical protein
MLDHSDQHVQLIGASHAATVVVHVVDLLLFAVLAIVTVIVDTHVCAY